MFLSLNVSYHNEQEYIWLRSGDIKGFLDIGPFYEVKGWNKTPGTQGVS